jgi:aminoglycoside phosphotransferase (APT) family kinase protein
MERPLDLGSGLNPGRLWSVATVSEAPSDHYRDPQTLDHLRKIASGIFAKHGIDFATAKRAGGWTNLTWLAGGLALRLAARPGQDKIWREAMLAALLPPAVGFPPILETGVIEEYEWSLSQEIPGKNLGDVWNNLTWNERTNALRQLWEKVLAVHSVDINAATGLAREKPWFNAADTQAAEASLSSLVKHKNLSSPQADILRAALARFWTVLPAAACVLNHGDLTIENALWHAGKVVSLLDFEFAVIAPAELDLNEIVKCAFAPGERHESLPDPERAGLPQMQKVVAELAKPVISHPGGKDLLMGYAILLELWMLEDWLAHPEGEGPLEQWQPYRMLLSLADGQGGYLAQLLA